VIRAAFLSSFPDKKSLRDEFLQLTFAEWVTDLPECSGSTGSFTCQLEIMDKQFIGLTVSLLILLPFATALRQTIQLDTINSWQYLCRFIFSDTPQKVFTKVPASIFDNATSYVDVSPYLNKYGLLKFSATFTAEIRPTLLLYRKYEDWRRVYTDDSEDCVSIASHADAVIQLRQKVSPLQNGGGYYLYNLPVVREDGSFAVNGVMAFPLLSDRDWTHIAVANCDVARGSCPAGDFCQGPLIINLKLHLTNGKNNELSRDERYIFAAAIALFIFQLIVAVWALFVRAALLSVQKYHHTARIILGSIFVHLSSLLLSIVYWSTYNATGRPILLLKFLGYLFMDIANILTIIEIILVAKGWTIVRKHLSNTGITRIGVYGVFLLVVTIFAEIFRVYLYDAAVSVSVYTSPPGIFLLLLRCGFAGSWFFYASFTTVRNYARKHKFYKKFIVCFGAWLEAPILFVLISFGVSRVKLTIFEYMWEWLLAVTPHVVFLILYDPNSRYCYCCLSVCVRACVRRLELCYVASFFSPCRALLNMSIGAVFTSILFLKKSVIHTLRGCCTENQ
jgi:hypothetical protein